MSCSDGELGDHGIQSERSDMDEAQQQLSNAIFRGEIETIASLIDAGVDVNYRTKAGCTPLMFAAMPNEYGDPTTPRAILEMVRLLLAHGADPTLRDKWGMSAQDYARQLIDESWKDLFGQPATLFWDEEDRSVIAEIIAVLSFEEAP